MRALALVVLISLAPACSKKIPDEVPYRALVSEAGSSEGPRRIVLLAGSELLVNGRPVATLEANETAVGIVASWTGPKSALRETIGAQFSLRGKGPCGPFETPLKAVNDYWKAATDEDVAQGIINRGAAYLSFEVELPASQTVVVDWGTGEAHAVAVGSLKIDPKDKRTPVVMFGCTKMPSVTVDGQVVGELEASSPAHLITIEPNVCHVLNDVAYSKEKGIRSPQHLPAKTVVSLRTEAEYVLEKAPDMQREGTVTAELLREPCAN